MWALWDDQRDTASTTYNSSQTDVFVHFLSTVCVFKLTQLIYSHKTLRVSTVTLQQTHFTGETSHPAHHAAAHSDLCLQTSGTWLFKSPIHHILDTPHAGCTPPPHTQYSKWSRAARAVSWFWCVEGDTSQNNKNGLTVMLMCTADATMLTKNIE